jgi:hypothetical protein
MPVKLNSTGGGSVTLTTPSTASDFTATFPANTGNVVTDSATQTLTNKTLTSPTITGASISAMASSVITSGTSVTASGTSVDFTGIPSWVKRVTVMFDGVSTSGTNSILVQLGDSGGVETTGYISTSVQISGGGLTADSTAGFVIRSATASNVFSGSMVVMNITGNDWVSQHSVKQTTIAIAVGAGDKTLSDTLDRVRITTVGGTDTFDAGSINILYE